MAAITFEMSSGSSFMSTVPELTGPNYTIWASKSKSWLQSQGIAYVLNTLRPGEIQIVGSTSPIPAPPAAPAGTTGGTTAAEEESDAGSGVSSPHFIAAASGSVVDWEKDNDKAMGVIKLRVAQAIGAKIENITTARVMWDTLKSLYGRPGAAEIFQNFKRAMNVEIPRNTHPGATIDLIKMYLTRITNAGDNTEIPMYLQYMIVINKLPPDIYAYIIAKITQDDVDDFEHEMLDNLRTHVVNTWEARGGKKPQSANATKITAIKRKGKPPVFEEQQQQRHKGSSSAWRGKGRGRGNWRGHGKRASEQTREKQQAQSMGPIKEYNEGLKELDGDLDQMSASNSSGWSQARSVTPLFEEISMSRSASNEDVDEDANSMPDLEPLSDSLDMDVISLGSDSEEEIISEGWNDGGYYSADDEPGRM
ncbi:hypothetical protein D9758_013276 [Tetrapyrgos nigripes]|uniref:DUF4219 domain-containing protein n=1 Tax=Tetrapyrgos nigripes TaxID=182062 RepID=A0A8H5FPH6_9AGAR|nr:hypothetical protein D9758_013276 [Tetrapyrgos nigripes]